MEQIESWRHVWRVGFAPQFSTDAIEKLREALVLDDPRLIQGATTEPPPLLCVQDWPVSCGCLVAYAGIVEAGGFESYDIEAYKKNLRNNQMYACTVGTAEEMFAKACFQADQLIGDTAGCRWLLNWFDDTPRDIVRRELIAEIDLTLKERSKDVTVSPPTTVFAEGAD